MYTYHKYNSSVKRHFLLEWKLYVYGQRALIGVAPSTCIRAEKDSWGPSVKLLIGVALFEVTVTKALQPLLDVLSLNTKLPFSRERTPLCLAYRMSCFYRCHLEVLIIGLHLATGFLPLFCGSERSNTFFCIY